MAIPKNRQAILDLTSALAPRILGRQLPGYSCNCGAIHCPTASAVEIIPGGGEQPGLEGAWSYWSVHMAPLVFKEGERAWNTGLSSFVEQPELDRLFAEYLPQGEEENPYRLIPSGEERLIEGLPLAVQIMETDQHVRVQVDFGTDQEIAVQLMRILSTNIRFTKSEDSFNVLLEFLRSLNPIVQVSGPSPELPHEPRWWDSYQDLMAAVSAGTYQNVSYGGYTSMGRDGRSYYLETSIFFHKQV